uniref:primase homolog protein-like n=1 Tax=Erigeron canadensis TaxID=72917 RepID=UPI001CB9317F|nr:primase homolog protein-like [Erigeron canadensis]
MNGLQQQRCLLLLLFRNIQTTSLSINFKTQLNPHSRCHHPQLSAPAVFRHQFPPPPPPLNNSSSENMPKPKEGEVERIKDKVDSIGINFDSCTRGHYTYLICPLCKGGQTKESSLSFHVNKNKNVAMWRCFNFECGWAGHVLADVGPTQDEVNKLKFSKELSEETLRLEPLGDEIIKYFAERMISVDTLQKNAVMQMVDDKNVIAYTYIRKGELVNCKFRSITSRKFWQVKHGESIFYGLDDIQEGNDIVIVEGEIDKLSMEEAGILNCVSVPDGAPQHVSTKASSSKKQNTRFKYLSDCNGHLDKAPRIILATDGDGPGQALAEELSRRLGKERCWLVTWPKKDDNNCYKDANEVLVHLGAEKLRQIVETAELYQVKNSL